jgi:NADH-quinone oxidoreductase subunit J
VFADLGFVVASAVALAGGVIAVGARNLYRAVMGLMLALAGVAALFLVQRAEFLAVIQVLVFVGGISVLIMFALILVEREGSPMEAGVNRAMVPAAAATAVVLAGAVIYAVIKSPLGSAPPSGVSARDLGEALLNRYLVPFEAVSLLLLAALVGALLIARERKD